VGEGERTLICRILMRKGLEMEWVRREGSEKGVSNDAA
jgi:hypothetical protein